MPGIEQLAESGQRSQRRSHQLCGAASSIVELTPTLSAAYRASCVARFHHPEQPCVPGRIERAPALQSARRLACSPSTAHREACGSVLELDRSRRCRVLIERVRCAPSAGECLAIRRRASDKTWQARPRIKARDLRRSDSRSQRRRTQRVLNEPARDVEVAPRQLNDSRLRWR
jgi:hypothetical protein